MRKDCKNCKFGKGLYGFYYRWCKKLRRYTRANKNRAKCMYWTQD